LFKLENFDNYFSVESDGDTKITNEISTPFFSKIKNSDEVISCKITERFGGQYRRILVYKYLSCNVVVDELNLQDFELNRGNCPVTDSSKRETIGVYRFGDSINIKIYDFIGKIPTTGTPKYYDGQDNCNLLEARFVIDSATYIYKTQ
jgi:hypothetical protein